MNDAIDLLDPNLSIDSKIKILFSELEKNYSIILIAPKNNYNAYQIRLAKYFSEKQKGIYISLNRKADELRKELLEKKVDSKDILFIDGLSEIVDEEADKTKNTLFISSPSEISALEEKIILAMEKQKKGFIIFDSLTTLLVYNEAETVEKFVHKLSAKIKESDFESVFLIVDSANERVLSTISQFFDKVIDLS